MARIASKVLAPLTSVIALVAAMAAFGRPIEVKDVWLKRNCLDKGTGDHPLHGKEFEACLRKQIESMPALDKNRRELFGERYDPPKYVDCRLQPGSRNNSACNVYVLRRRDWPEYWPPSAVRPKWPEAPKQSVYRKGMKPREYWEALCKAEAGEFIHRTVKDVEGFLLIRPRGAESDYAMQDKYVVEDAYGLHEFGYHDEEKRAGAAFFLRSSETYRYVESGLTTVAGKRVPIRHEVVVAKLAELLQSKPSASWSYRDFSQIVEIDHFRSRYGVTWRGIRRERDIETGISGGELAVVDLEDGAVLALRRGFALDPFAARGAESRRSWLGSSGCPVMVRESQTLSAFVRKVLVPKNLNLGGGK